MKISCFVGKNNVKFLLIVTDHVGYNKIEFYVDLKKKTFPHLQSLGFTYFLYLCRPAEVSPRYCAIPGDNPPRDRHRLPSAGEKPDSNPRLLVYSEVRYYYSQGR